MDLGPSFGPGRTIYPRRGASPPGERVLLGAHVSIAGGFANAPKAGKYIGCEAIQVFARSPRMLRKTKPIPAEEARTFQAGMKAAKILVAVTHGNYLINLASPVPRLQRVARTAFTEELARAEVLGCPYVIFHPGAHMGKGEAKGVKKIALALDWAIGRAKAPHVTAVLENTAGSGTVLGSRFEHLRAIIDHTSFPDRLGVCVDTCHTLTAGYDYRTPEGYEDLWRTVDATVGLGHVKAFHLNDAKDDLGSHRDRHENIGRGKVGLEPFRWLVNDPRFASCPGILETPGTDRAFKRNLKLLKSLRPAASSDQPAIADRNRARNP